MLVIVVFGVGPVKTDLVFDSIDECLRAEEAMPDTYARHYTEWLRWAQQNQAVSGYPTSRGFQLKPLGMENYGTCVPHAALRP